MKPFIIIHFSSAFTSKWFDSTWCMSTCPLNGFILPKLQQIEFFHFWIELLFACFIHVKIYKCNLFPKLYHINIIPYWFAWVWKDLYFIHDSLINLLINCFHISFWWKFMFSLSWRSCCIFISSTKVWCVMAQWHQWYPLHLLL